MAGVLLTNHRVSKVKRNTYDIDFNTNLVPRVLRLKLASGWLPEETLGNWNFITARFLR